MGYARLDTQVTLLRDQPTTDAMGAPVKNLVQVATVWANRADQGGRVFRSYGVLHSETTTVFKIRYRQGLDATFFLRLSDGSEYKLTQPPMEPEGERKAWLILQARRLS